MAPSIASAWARSATAKQPVTTTRAPGSRVAVRRELRVASWVTVQVLTTITSGSFLGDHLEAERGKVLGYLVGLSLVETAPQGTESDGGH